MPDTREGKGREEDRKEREGTISPPLTPALHPRVARPPWPVVYARRAGRIITLI